MGTNEMIRAIKDALDTFDASVFMSKWRTGGLSQSEKMQNVKDNLQSSLKEHLEQVFRGCYPQLTWIVEKKLEGCNDSVDIYASDSSDWEIIIEIDAARADQVAKKIVSRYSHISESRKNNILYIALCYPGTERMNLNECEKFMYYGKKIIKKIHGNAFFISAFVKDDKIISE